MFPGACVPHTVFVVQVYVCGDTGTVGEEATAVMSPARHLVGTAKKRKKVSWVTVDRQ